MQIPLQQFADLKDPRLPRTRRHLLHDIVLIAIAAILSGAEGWDDIERYGKAKQEWLKSFLALPYGIPSHDTFNRVFQALDPAELENHFLDWVRTIASRSQGEVVAIDGKSLRGTCSSDGKPLVHMVSAWASANNLVLGQRKTDAKSNEITAIPELLRVLELSGATVTIDAMGCQKNIARQIVEQKDDYVLAVKENQPSLLADVKDSFQMLAADAVANETDCGHGRVETRCCSVLADLSLIDNTQDWAALRSVVRIEAMRMNTAIRQHWGIENKLHWVLDMDFGEDAGHKRAGYAAQNFSLLNRIALNLIRKDISKGSIRGKRL